MRLPLPLCPFRSLEFHQPSVLPSLSVDFVHARRIAEQGAIYNRATAATMAPAKPMPLATLAAAALEGEAAAPPAEVALATAEETLAETLLRAELALDPAELALDEAEPAAPEAADEAADVADETDDAADDDDDAPPADAHSTLLGTVTPAVAHSCTAKLAAFCWSSGLHALTRQHDSDCR